MRGKCAKRSALAALPGKAWERTGKRREGGREREREGVKKNVWLRRAMKPGN